MSPEPNRVCVFLHDGSYDRVHQGLAIAASAVASGRRADVYWFWWALERLVRDRLDEPDFGPGREAHADRFEARGMPTLRELLAHLRESGLCSTFACSASLAALDVKPPELEGKVDQVIGWTAILQRTAGLTDRFYL